LHFFGKGRFHFALTAGRVVVDACVTTKRDHRRSTYRETKTQSPLPPRHQGTKKDKELRGLVFLGVLVVKSWRAMPKRKLEFTLVELLVGDRHH
jgi:hypothetical protein